MATPEVTQEAVRTFDLAVDTVRELNQALHSGSSAAVVSSCAIRADATRSRSGSTRRYEVEIEGHVGYYCAGMNKLATVRVRGNCGVGVAENMMSGS